MTVDVQKYSDPDVVGGNADGSSWANAYGGIDAALTAEHANGQDYTNINEATISNITAFTTANQTLTFSPSGATARFISQVSTTLQYEVLTGTPTTADSLTGATEGSADVDTIDDTSGGAVTIKSRNSDTTGISHSSTTVTDATNKLIIEGDFTGAKPDSTKAEINVGNATAVTLNTEYVLFKNIQILWAPTSNSRRGITWSGTGLLETDTVILKCAATGGNYIRGIVPSGNVYLKNTLLLDIKRGSNDYIGIYQGGARTLRVYNCALDNCYRGVTNDSSVDAEVVNTAMNCNILTAGTGTTNLTNCASTAGTGTNAVTISDWNEPDVFDNRFLDDFDLGWNSVLLNTGVGSSTDSDVPATDIYGNTRTAATTTDIGVHYDSAQHPTATDPRIEYAFNETSGLVCASNYNTRLNGVIGEEITVTDTGAAITEYQGYTTDGTSHYVSLGSGGGTLTKYNSDYSTATATNTAVFADLSGSPNTLGGMRYYNNLIYVSAEVGSCTSYQPVSVAIYNTSLVFQDEIDMSNEEFEISCCTVNEDDGYVYAMGYCFGNRVWVYDLATPYAFVGTIDLDARVHANGIFYDTTTATIYVACKNDSATAGAERILNFDLSGNLIGSWNAPTIAEMEDIEIVGGDFRYNDYPTPHITTATYPTAPTRTEGSIHLDKTYYIDIFDEISDEATFIIGLKATTFFADNTFFDSHIGDTEWFGSIDASGVLSFVIDGASPVTHTLPSATTEYKIAITIGGSGATRTVKLYVDDTLEDTQTQDWVAPPAEWYSLGAGNSNNTKSDCELFYFAAFDYELSSTEVSDYTPPAYPTSGILPLMMAYT